MDNIDELWIRRILTRQNIRVEEVRRLASGVASHAWFVLGGCERFVFRCAIPDSGRVCSYRSEHLVLQKLLLRGCPVPEPVATSFDDSSIDLEGESAWSITRAVDGNSIAAGEPPLSLAREIGKFLAMLHSIDIIKFGPLRQKAGVLEGTCADNLTGTMARWSSAPMWPFDGNRLESSDLHGEASSLLARVTRFASSILHWSNVGNVVLNHSDIHGDHVFAVNGHLSGIIDFGGCFIGPAGWDFAALAIFLGWPCALNALEAYAKPADRGQLLMQTELLALALGIYRLRVETMLGASQVVITRLVGVVEQTLVVLESRWRA